jgi:hypothetical protein
MKPSWSKVLFSGSYTGPFLAIMSVVMLALAIAIAFKLIDGTVPQARRANLVGTCFVTSVIAALCVIGLRRYVHAIQRLVENGTRVEAVIVSTGSGGAGGWILIRYSYSGKTYVTSNAVMMNVNLSPGQSVTAIVDPVKPKRAVIEQLFTG